MKVRCAISIDLDALPCYYRIHALGAAPDGLRHVILQRALPRAAAWFAARGVHVTWFCVGADLDAAAATDAADRALRQRNRELLAERAAAGDELGNHSYAHHFDLARRDTAEVAADIERADTILRSVGARPRDVFMLLWLESCLLASAGALGGILLMYAALIASRPLLLQRMGVAMELGAPTTYDLALLAAVIGASLLIGAWPAVRAYRRALADGLSIRL